ncbi:MAG: hypothetical protein QOI27_3128 [Gaiellaceae bacterium]|jgi:hypothetical protein|nr:hypothetical protein [Gaiellaceae bacterium]
MDDAEGSTNVFRDANSCIDELLERFGTVGIAEFLCECPSARCSRFVALTRHGFERIRRDGAFIVAEDCPYAEQAFGTGTRYVVVPDLRAVSAAAADWRRPSTPPPWGPPQAAQPAEAARWAAAERRELAERRATAAGRRSSPASGSATPAA